MLNYDDEDSEYMFLCSVICGCIAIIALSFTLIVMFAGCTKDPHLVKVNAKSGECEVSVDLIIQKPDKVILPKGL